MARGRKQTGAGSIGNRGGVANSVDQRQLERQSRQSQRLEVLGRLAGGIAHDFNNLLTGVMLYSDLLANTCPEGTPQRKYADEIRLAAKRGASMIEQLMTFARQQSSEPVMLSLNQVIAGIKDVLQRLIGENIELVTNCSESLPLVRADASQMQQVLVNLVVNAKDAMPSGGRITIETSSVDVSEADVQAGGELQSGLYVSVSVADTGSGIDANTRAHLFEPFFTTKPRGKGTGLGLASAYGIVTHAGGTISIESQPGRGARFTVLLPVAEPAGGLVAPESRTADRTINRGCETVLLVEDDALVRASMHNLLSQCGYNVLQARDAKDALELAHQHKGPIHLLLTDVVLPGISGRDLAATLGRVHHEMRVLYVTGYAEELQGDRQTIAKPFNETALAEKVRQVLDARAALAAGAP